jgi:hypothetical protein
VKHDVCLSGKRSEGAYLPHDAAMFPERQTDSGMSSSTQSPSVLGGDEMREVLNAGPEFTTVESYRWQLSMLSVLWRPTHRKT